MGQGHWALPTCNFVTFFGDTGLYNNEGKQKIIKKDVGNPRHRKRRDRSWGWAASFISQVKMYVLTIQLRLYLMM